MDELIVDLVRAENLLQENGFRTSIVDQVSEVRSTRRRGRKNVRKIETAEASHTLFAVLRSNMSF